MRIFLVKIDDFNAVLAPFCCYDYSANSSESVENIATD